jgi:hypothetical protein
LNFPSPPELVEGSERAGGEAGVKIKNPLEKSKGLFISV